MRELFTIGYTKKRLREFVTRIKTAGVDCVVDIRLNNTSQLAGFAKREDLGFLLEEGFGIRYVHMLSLAPTEEILSRYKSGKDFKAYASSYAELMEGRGMVTSFLKSAEDGGWERPCLLCAEDESDKCHRRLLAEAIAERSSGLEVRHL